VRSVARGRVGAAEKIANLSRALSSGAGYAVGQHFGMGAEGAVGGLLLGESVAHLLNPVSRAATRAVTTSPLAQAR
jgi:hypothetical protein